MSFSSNEQPQFQFSLDVPNDFHPSYSQGELGLYSPWQPPLHIVDGNSSPVLSVRTQTSAPNPKPHDNSPMILARIAQYNNRLDPNLQMLDVPPMAVRPRSSESGQAPGYHGQQLFSQGMGTIHDDPWSSERRRVNGVSAASFIMPHAGRSDNIFRRIFTPSNHVNQQSDSGYATQPAHSVVSNEHERVDDDSPSAFSISVRGLNAEQRSKSGELHPARSDVASQYSSRSKRSGRYPKESFKCDACNEAFNCPSDLKKHKLKHDKPYLCDQRGCRHSKVDQGFTTSNDLTRHKKSVHRIGVDKDSYKCGSERCRGKDKIWPRLDNFKQHLRRMHNEENMEYLINSSVYSRPNTDIISSYPASTSPGAPAEVDADKLYFGNEFNKLASPFHSLQGNASGQWWDRDLHKALANSPSQTTPFAMGSNFSSFNNLRSPSLPSLDPNQKGHGDLNNLEQQGLKPVPVPATLVGATLEKETAKMPLSRRGSAETRTNPRQVKSWRKRKSVSSGSNIRRAQKGEKSDIEDVIQILQSIARQDQPIGKLDRTNNKLSNDGIIVRSLDSDDAISNPDIGKVVRVLQDLIKGSQVQNPRSKSPLSSLASATKKFECTHPGCSTTFARCCELTKHLKRHAKPYGCTNSRCFKVFGAKSDWKRHEITQHFQEECFLCQHPVLTASSADPDSSRQSHGQSWEPCGTLFFRPDYFQTHLENQHHVVADNIPHYLQSCVIGRNGQTRFWCGFCKKLIPLQKRLHEAWDERFNHIDEEHYSAKQSVDEWFCVEERLTKKELREQKDEATRENIKVSVEQREEDAEGETETASSASPGTRDNSNDDALQIQMASVASAAPFVEPNSRLKKKQKLCAADEEMEDVPEPKRPRRELRRYCCSCKCGPWSFRLHGTCLDCNHRLCESCDEYAEQTSIE